LVIIIGLMLIVGYAFLAGPLFAWSPIKPGYEVVHSKRADVYFGSGRTLDPAFKNVDQFVEAMERFHQLSMTERMTIIVCRDWSDCHRFLPTLRGEGVGAATPEFGTIIYVTPKIEQMKFETGEFVRHELSHAILHQNATLWNSLKFKRAQWLLEGLGVLAADQQAYGGWTDFQQSVRTQSLQPLFTPTPRPADMRFAYLAWRYYLNWLIETRGRATFQQYLTRFLEQPADSERLFQEIYGESLTTAVTRFEQWARKS
jgi:hypothetical protein